MQISQEYKAHLEKNIVEGIAYGVENQTIQQNELADIARFVLDHIDVITTQEELKQFLADLTAKWPSLEHVALVARRDLDQQEDMQAADHVTDLLKEGQLDEALTAAKSATEE